MPATTSLCCKLGRGRQEKGSCKDAVLHHHHHLNHPPHPLCGRNNGGCKEKTFCGRSPVNCERQQQQVDAMSFRVIVEFVASIVITFVIVFACVFVFLRQEPFKTNTRLIDFCKFKLCCASSRFIVQVQALCLK